MILRKWVAHFSIVLKISSRNLVRAELKILIFKCWNGLLNFLLSKENTVCFCFREYESSLVGHFLIRFNVSGVIKSGNFISLTRNKMFISFLKNVYEKWLWNYYLHFIDLKNKQCGTQNGSLKDTVENLIWFRDCLFELWNCSYWENLLWGVLSDTLYRTFWECVFHGLDSFPRVVGN